MEQTKSVVGRSFIANDVTSCHSSSLPFHSCESGTYDLLLQHELTAHAPYHQNNNRNHD